MERAGPRVSPPSAPGMEGSSRPPRGTAQWPDVPARPYLCSASSSLPGPPSASSPAALPRLLPRDRRPPTRKCPGVTLAAAAMETLPAPVPPPPPAPSHRPDPPPPPSWTHNEARRCPTRPRSLLPPPPSWEPSLAEAGAALAAVGVGARPDSGIWPPGPSPAATHNQLRHLPGPWPRSRRLSPRISAEVPGRGRHPVEKRGGKNHKAGLVPLRFMLAARLCCVNYQDPHFENLILLFWVFFGFLWRASGVEYWTAEVQLYG